MTTSVDRMASAKSSASAASVMGPGADPATLLEEKGNVVCCINMKLGVMHIVCVRKTLMFKLNIQTCFVVIMCYLTCLLSRSVSIKICFSVFSWSLAHHFICYCRF